MKPQRNQIFNTFYTIDKYLKWNKQNKSTPKSVGFVIANNIQTKQTSQGNDKEDVVEAAWAVTKIVNTVNKQLEQFKMMTQEMFKSIHTAVEISNNNTGKNQPSGNSWSCQHRCQCLHCKCCYPKIPDKKSRVLKANTAACPASWMSIKNRPQCSTWRCMEHKVIEQWQPGKVEIHKITKNFPYLVATGSNAPPDKIQHTYNT